MHKAGSLIMAAAGTLAATAAPNPIEGEFEKFMAEKKAEGWIDVTLGPNRKMVRARAAMARRRTKPGRRRR